MAFVTAAVWCVPFFRCRWFFSKTTTAKKVRNKLEEDTGLDISLKIEEISRIMQEVMDETVEEKEVLESGAEDSEEV